jgi:hypothetical protein
MQHQSELQAAGLDSTRLEGHAQPKHTQTVQTGGLAKYNEPSCCVTWPHRGNVLALFDINQTANLCSGERDMLVAKNNLQFLRSTQGAFSGGQPHVVEG